MGVLVNTLLAHRVACVGLCSEMLLVSSSDQPPAYGATNIFTARAVLSMQCQRAVGATQLRSFWSNTLPVGSSSKTRVKQLMARVAVSRASSTFSMPYNHSRSNGHICNIVTGTTIAKVRGRVKTRLLKIRLSQSPRTLKVLNHIGIASLHCIRSSI